MAAASGGGGERRRRRATAAASDGGGERRLRRATAAASETPAAMMAEVMTAGMRAEVGRNSHVAPFGNVAPFQVSPSSPPRA